MAIKEEGVGMHSQMDMMGSNDMDLQNQSYMPLKMPGGQSTSRDMPSLDPSGVNPAGPFFSGGLGGLQHMTGANFGNQPQASFMLPPQHPVGLQGPFSSSMYPPNQFQQLPGSFPPQPPLLGQYLPSNFYQQMAP